MEDIQILYKNGKLLVRAMDWPQLKKGINGLEYDEPIIDDIRNINKYTR